MSAGKIAEYAVGILVPLGMFWLIEKMGKGTSNPARGGSQNPKQSKGALPPLRSPFSESGTTRILSELAKIQRACWSTGGAVRLLTFSNGLQNGHMTSRKWLQSWVYFGRPRGSLAHRFQKIAVEKPLASGPLPGPESGP